VASVIYVFSIIDGAYFYFAFKHLIEIQKLISLICIIVISVMIHLGIYKYEAYNAQAKWKVD